MTASVKEQDRLTQRFELWDADHDGQINRDDFDSEARSILRRFKEPESSAKGRQIMTTYLAMWDKIAQKAGVQKNGSLTAEQFRKVVETQMLSNGAAGFNEVLRPTIQAIANLCDTDGDGQVNPQEFVRWTDAIGVARSEADSAFRQIDTNGNGYLSVDELVDAVRAYHAGELDAPLLGS